MRSDDTLRALDEATRAIAGELDLERVLQLMVDSVRSLVGSRYAALGIVNNQGGIERFITSGLSPEGRALIGPPPRGHGLLGTIIREGVSLRIPDIARHGDTYGFPPNHPPMHSFLGVPVVIGGEPVGNFYLTEKEAGPEFEQRDQQLVEMFAVHAGIAIQNARLHRQVQELAVVDERLRISRDLHDGIIQSIYAVGLSLEDVPELMVDDPVEAENRIDRAIDRLHMTIGDIRTFITRLAMPVDTSLSAAIQDIVVELVHDPRFELDLDLAQADTIDGRLSPEATNELLQMLREAVSNTVRHSGARHGRVAIANRDSEVVLEIADDGRGFDPATPVAHGHFGLANLRNRAHAAGGELEIDSAANKGTRVIIRLPLFAPETLAR